PQPGAEARAAHGPETEIDRGAAGRGPAATGGGSHPRGTRAQLWRRQEHDFTALVLIEILLGGIPALASAPSDRRSCRGNEPEGMFMSRLMIVVEFEVKPEHRSAFVELMKGHAQRSRAEDGCQQFDVLVPQEDQSRVFLVEAWRDQAALDVHIKLPAMARLREAWQPWLVSMKATGCIAHKRSGEASKRHCSAATTSAVIFRLGRPRFCARARQAMAQPAKYFAAPGRPRAQVKTGPRVST